MTIYFKTIDTDGTTEFKYENCFIPNSILKRCKKYKHNTTGHIVDVYFMYNDHSFYVNEHPKNRITVFNTTMGMIIDKFINNSGIPSNVIKGDGIDSVLIIEYDNESNIHLSALYLNEFELNYTSLADLYMLENSDILKVISEEASIASHISNYRYTICKDITTFDFIQEKKMENTHNYLINMVFDEKDININYICSVDFDLEKHCINLLNSLNLSHSTENFTIDTTDAIFVHTIK